MRILMISDVYFPRINGVSTSIQTYRETLTEQGCQIDLIVPQYANTTDDEQGIYRVAARTVPLDPEDRLMNKKQLRQQAETLLQQNQYDLIHIQTPFLAHYVGTELARKHQLPVVETYHTYFEEYLYNYIPFLPKQFLRMLVRRFTLKQCNALDAMVVPSTAMLEALQNYGVKTPSEIIPTGIHPELFRNGDGESFRVKHGIKIDAPVLVHVGRICHEKNIDFLFHMHKQLLQTVPEAILLIAGEGPATKHLKKLCIKLATDKNVKFVGYLDRKHELQDCYAAGDTFVFSSRTETQGLVLLEAMACGTPVVSTAIMGTKDILGPQRGALVAEENHKQFAEKVSLLLKNNDFQQQLSDEAISYVKEWSVDHFTGKMLNFYQRTLKNYHEPESISAESKNQETVTTTA